MNGQFKILHFSQTFGKSYFLTNYLVQCSNNEIMRYYIIKYTLNLSINIYLLCFS